MVGSFMGVALLLVGSESLNSIITDALLEATRKREVYHKAIAKVLPDSDEVKFPASYRWKTASSSPSVGTVLAGCTSAMDYKGLEAITYDCLVEITSSVDGNTLTLGARVLYLRIGDTIAYVADEIDGKQVEVGRGREIKRVVDALRLSLSVEPYQRRYYLVKRRLVTKDYGQDSSPAKAPKRRAGATQVIE